MAKLGVATDQLRLVDGSGLSRADLVAPHQLNTPRNAMQRHSTHVECSWTKSC